MGSSQGMLGARGLVVLLVAGPAVACLRPPLGDPATSAGDESASGGSSASDSTSDGATAPSSSGAVTTTAASTAGDDGSGGSASDSTSEGATTSTTGDAEPGCVLNPAMMQLPAVVYSTIALGDSNGEVAFDGDCDLLVVTHFLGGLARVSRIDGAVSSVIDDFALGAEVTHGVVFNPNDGRIYVSTDMPAGLFSLSGAGDPAVLHVEFEAPAVALAVAPAGFGADGGRVIAAFPTGEVMAIDPGEGSATVLGVGDMFPNDLAFAPDGTLYLTDMLHGQLVTMTPEGAFSVVTSALVLPTALAVAHDGSRLFVMHSPVGYGRIDSVSLPGGALTPGAEVTVYSSWATNGLVVDAADHVFFKEWNEEQVLVDVFTTL